LLSDKTITNQQFCQRIAAPIPLHQCALPEIHTPIYSFLLTGERDFAIINLQSNIGVFRERRY